MFYIRYCLLIVYVLSISGAAVFSGNSGAVERDSEGREIIVGPVSGNYYYNVHIVSSSVGVISDGTTIIKDSVIDAPVCIKSSGVGLTVQNNQLNCNLCVEFSGSIIMNNNINSNRCTGRGTNRPDIFGW